MRFTCNLVLYWSNIMDICTCARMIQDDKPVTYSAAKQLLQDASEGLENVSILTESVKSSAAAY